MLIKSFLEAKNIFWEQPKYTPEWVPNRVLYFYAHVHTIAHMLDPFFFGKY